MTTQLFYYHELSAIRPRLTKTAFWKAVESYVKQYGHFPLSMECALYEWPDEVPDGLEDATWEDVYAYVYRKEVK